VVQVLQRYGVDVVGLQEFQRPQHRAFLAQAGGAYAVWSSRRDTENAIAWRRERFRLVSATTVAIPYFDGHPRAMPVVRLQDLVTGTVTTFLNVHNPADTRRYPRQGRWRAMAVAREARLVRRLSESGAPVVVTGDMNDRRDVYCRLTSGGLTHAAQGTTSAGSCRLPSRSGIDWIFGTRSTSFSDYTHDSSRLVRRTTDHPFVVARAHVG
jgi:endonuclease/exonuclease/phosphatase family metal-dependent hydrolase